MVGLVPEGRMSVDRQTVLQVVLKGWLLACLPSQVNA